MKKYSIMILWALIFINCKAQTVPISDFNQGSNDGKYFKDIDNNFQNFLGTWEGLVSNNNTFQLNLFKITKKRFSAGPEKYNEDIIGGSFQIIENAHLPNEIILYNSIKYYPQSNITTQNVMYFTATSPLKGGGFMEDNCANGGTDSFTVQVVFEILNINDYPLQMHWLAKKKMMFQSWYLSIPKDIILIKQP